ncbi:MAG: Mur ligase family protein [Betaproteobacteria bacterium]
MLEALGPTTRDMEAHERWRVAASAMCHALGWTTAQPIVLPHASGTLLAFAAPMGTLFTATEVNEWAWEQASGIFQPGFEPAIDPPFDRLHHLGANSSDVVATFKARATAEENAMLTALCAAAHEHGVPLYVDDESVSLGAGAHSQTWPLAALPEAPNVEWSALRAIPTVLVTGSNGKTTTVRLLAALIAASETRFEGHVGYSSTEGVVIGDARAGEGDFSGPAGARLVLRDQHVEAAVLETARGGILRRGLAVDKADVAIVTNVSADHFGEYGINSLDDLADVKLTVRYALGTVGTLVLNADDKVLLARASSQVCKVALFALDDSHPALVTHRKNGGDTCGLADEQLVLSRGDERFKLGNYRDMPLTLNGAAMFNVANIAAAALAALALRISPAVITEQLQCFGQSRLDNAGRLDHWKLADITVVIDYAHNPDGLKLLLDGMEVIRRDHAAVAGNNGRIGLLLGQAGNRSDQAIIALARVAAVARPALIVVKEIPRMLRGRAAGEVTALLKEALLAAAYPAEQIRVEADEIDAASQLLQWAKAGDVVVLPIHQATARKSLAAMLDAMEKSGWRAGAPLPVATLSPPSE